MNIIYDNKKIQKQCDNPSSATHGKQVAEKLKARLEDLHAAPSLEEIGHLPPARCHELTGNRSGQLAICLHGPHRLIFVPAHDPIPKKDDGGLDWSQVTTVNIISIEDYHK